MLKIGFFWAGYFKLYVWIWELHFLACENGFQNHSSHFKIHQCWRFHCQFKCIVRLSLSLKNCMIFHVLWNTLNYLSLSACYFSLHNILSTNRIYRIMYSFFSTEIKIKIFFILKIRMMEVKEFERLKMLKKQLLQFPGLNGLLPWHLICQRKPHLSE